MIVILVFTAIEPPYVSVVLTAFVSFMFTYMLRLQSLLEKPFRPSVHTRDDVSLFLLRDFASAVEAEASAGVATGLDARPSPEQMSAD